MTPRVFLRLGFLLALAFAVAATPACHKDSAPKPLPGSAFNKFFPKAQGGSDVVYTQEKEGFAQAVVKTAGKEVATLSISDVLANPDAVAKFANSTEKIADQPAAPNGSQGTAILVANRFQVQARSSVDSFTAEDRKAWLERFDIGGLKALAP